MNNSPASPVGSSSPPEQEPQTSELRRNVRRLGVLSRRLIASTVDIERQVLFRLNPSRWPAWRQLRHAGRVFSNTERRLLLVCFVVGVGAAIWLSLNYVRTLIIETPAPGGTYTEAIIGQPHYVNPLLAGSNVVDADLTRLIYSGLFRYDESLVLQPDLAVNYSLSDDQRIYLVTLRDDIAWHDGEPIRADDVVFTFTSVRDTTLNSPLGPSFQSIVIEKVDERIVRFTLSEPYRGFLDLLTVGLVPEHVWGDIPKDQWRQREAALQPVGNGPWQFESLGRDINGDISTYTLQKTTSSGSSAPLLEHLIFRFFPDEEQALRAIERQQVDGLAFLSGNPAERLRGNKRLAMYDVELPGVTAVFFNLGRSSPLDDIAVRRALRAAIDRRRLAQEILKGDGTIATQPFPPFRGEEQAENDEIKADPETLLTNAGWERVGVIRRRRNGETLNLTLSVLDRQPDVAVAGYLQETWRALGVSTKLDLISPSAGNVERTLLRPRAYQAVLYTTVYGATVDPYPFWHSSQRLHPGLNLSLFSNHEADRLIEEGRRARDQETAATSYAGLGRVINDEAAAIFLYQPHYQYIIKDHIHIALPPKLATAADRFAALSRWYVNTNWSFGGE